MKTTKKTKTLQKQPNSKTILAIETTSTSGSIAISKNNILLFSSFLNLRTTHSERLMPQIDNGLKLCGINIKDLDLILISNGPGSFTGVRIGLATAKGLCTGLNIPLIPYNTLDVLAFQVYPTKFPVVSVIDARLQEVYVAIYDHKMNRIKQPFHCKPPELINMIEEKVVVVGSGLLRFKDLFAKDNFIHPLDNQNIPQAQTMIGMFFKNEPVTKFDYDKIAKLEPYYLRKSQAEINFEERQK